jgi:hypothetical protein
VDWNDDALPTPRHDENMVTPLDPDQAPTLPLNDPRQVFARNLFHRANSMTRSFCAIPLSLVSTERHNSMASRKLEVTSSSVSPWVTHPGKAGTQPKNRLLLLGEESPLLSFVEYNKD